MPSKFTREVEARTLEFAKTLKADMSPTEVKKLFDQIEEEHAFIEAKLIVLGVVYRSVLEDIFQKEERELLPPAMR